MPAIAQDYINTNFANATFEEAGQDTLCVGTEVIEVALTDGTTEIEITFDLSGNLVYVATEITSADLPTNISESITTNYADYSIDDDIDQLELPDGTIQYEVGLINTTNQQELEVIFSSDGTVICEE